MNTRRIAVTLGAAGGGVLAAAFLSSGLAYAAPDPAPAFPDPGTADVFGFATDTTLPNSGAESVVAVSGLPPLEQQVEGYQTLDFEATPTGATAATTVGTVNVDESTFTSSFGFDNQEYLVTGSTALDTSAGVPIDAGALPTDGSVYDIASFGGFTNYYESAVGTATTAGATPTDTIADELVLPSYLGGGDIDLTPYLGGFDASAGLSGDVLSPATTLISDLATEVSTDTSLTGGIGADLATDFTNLLGLF